MSRPYTEREIRDQFINHIHALIHYWKNETDRNTELERMRGLAFSILVTLDGESASLPAFKVVPSPHHDDMEYHKGTGENYYPIHLPGCEVNISGCLHERFYSILKDDQDERD